MKKIENNILPHHKCSTIEPNNNTKIDLHSEYINHLKTASVINKKAVPQIIPVIFHILCPVSLINQKEDSKIQQLGIYIDPLQKTYDDLNLCIDKLNRDFSGSMQTRYNSSNIKDSNNLKDYNSYINSRTPININFVKSKVIITNKKLSVKYDKNTNNLVKNSSKRLTDASVGSAKTLNIWIVNFIDGILGYAQFPWEFKNSPNFDGIVLQWNTIKKSMNLLSPYTDNKTITHEVGHWLGLYHTFQPTIINNNLGAVDYDGNGLEAEETKGDCVEDTPLQINPTFGNPYKSGIYPVCNNKLSMFINFMDYSDDDVMCMFTLDQSKKIDYMLNTYRK